MQTETELKLLCDDDFELSELLAATRKVAEVSEPTVIDQVDVYLDTRSRSLQRAGLSARVRRKGQKRKIEIKPVPLITAVVMERAEIEAELPRGKAAGVTLRQVVEECLPIKLRGVPIERVMLKTRRRRYDVRTEGLHAELCVDEVSVMRPGSRRSFLFEEVELELREGERGDFDRIAASIAELPPLMPSGKSKYVRALELLGLPGFAFGSAKPLFKAEHSADEVARMICNAQFEAMRSYEPGTRVGLDPEQLHKMRVATRRLRAALKTFSFCFDRRNGDFLSRNYKWLAAVLGDVRDLDVHLLRAPIWEAELGKGPEKEGWAELRAVLHQRWEAARERLLLALNSRRYERLCERSVAAFSQTPRRRSEHAGGRAVGLVASKAVKKAERRFLGALQHYHQCGDAESMHALRIVGKKLRYTGEFFKPLYSPAFAKRLKELAAFQDEVGLLQDDVVAHALARELYDSAPRATAPTGSGPQRASGAYLHVLGLLAGSAIASERYGGLRVEQALREIDEERVARDLLVEARKVARRLLKEQAKAAKAAKT
ncbi:MAG: CHAD domain-containing protein [Deltaproteobacteria bacterium]|nr:CHAD domain-containing protein [Deltaproteobacteria bacterium]